MLGLLNTEEEYRMPFWDISKDIEFCYGHRVWTQDLKEEYAMTSHCKCRHLHGHQGKMTVHLKGEELKAGMVTDFNHLSWLKKFMDDYIDHKFILDMNDPLYDKMIDIDHSHKKILVPGTDWVAGYQIVLDEKTTKVEEEYYNSFFLVNFTPTSENLCKWAHTITDVKMRKLGVDVSGIDWWETPKSVSRYRV